MRHPFGLLARCLSARANAPRQCRSPRIRYRPVFEHLETREVPAIVGGEFGVKAGVFGVGGSSPFPRVSISKTLVAVSQNQTVDDCIALFRNLGPNVTSGAPRDRGNGQLKYWVCHHTGSAANPFVMINVAEPAAFGGHLRHGDMVFIRRTPGGPLTTVQLNEQRSEEHTSELQSLAYLVCRLLLEKKKKNNKTNHSRM